MNSKIGYTDGVLIKCYRLRRIGEQRVTLRKRCTDNVDTKSRCRIVGSKDASKSVH